MSPSCSCTLIPSPPCRGSFSLVPFPGGQGARGSAGGPLCTVTWCCVWEPLQWQQRHGPGGVEAAGPDQPSRAAAGEPQSHPGPCGPSARGQGRRKLVTEHAREPKRAHAPSEGLAVFLYPCVTDGTGSPQNSYPEVLTPRVTMLEDRPFKEIIKVQ